MKNSFSDRIHSIAIRQPEHISVKDKSSLLSYKELDINASSFAHYLLNKGCKPGDRVVLFAFKQAFAISAILGIFRARAIYVPIDTQAPEKRVRFILNDIQPSFIITDTSNTFIENFAQQKNITVIPLSVLHKLTGKAIEQKHSLPEIKASDTAYCIYTSGSTGFPKGVLIRHSSLNCFLEGMVEFYDVNEQSRCASFSPLYFDAIVTGMLLPLAFGASLYIYNDINFPDNMFEWLQSNQITHFTAFGMMLDIITQTKYFHSEKINALKTILTGADAPHIKTINAWLKRYNNTIKIINAYGPTEATCAVSAYTIRQYEPERENPYPIGQTFKHVQACLCDKEENIIPLTDTTSVGELLLSGPQLMQGYWNNSKKTEAAFTTINENIFYKTGDICRYTEDGHLMFMTRKDNELDICGYRVNPSEIQRIINQNEQVMSSEIFFITTKNNEKFIVAAALTQKEKTPKYEDSLLEANIKSQLTKELPNYMIPRSIIFMSDFPRLSCGKTDRKQIYNYVNQILVRSFY